MPPLFPCTNLYPFVHVSHLCELTTVDSGKVMEPQEFTCHRQLPSLLHAVSPRLGSVDGDGWGTCFPPTPVGA